MILVTRCSKYHVSLLYPSRLLKNCVERAISARVCVIFPWWRFFGLFFALPSAPCGGFNAIQRHYGPDLLRRNPGGHQVSHAHQVVGRTSKGKHPVHFQRPAMPNLA